MEVTRRDLLRIAAAGRRRRAGRPAPLVEAADAPERLLDFEALGNVTLLHLTDTHATLLPVYYREPDTLLGVGDERGKPPYLTGAALLAQYGIAPGSALAYALHPRRFPRAGRALRADGRLRAPGHAGETRAGRAGGAHAAARRGRRAAGVGDGAVEPG